MQLKRNHGYKVSAKLPKTSPWWIFTKWGWWMFTKEQGNSKACALLKPARASSRLQCEPETLLSRVGGCRCICMSWMVWGIAEIIPTFFKRCLLLASFLCFLTKFPCLSMVELLLAAHWGLLCSRVAAETIRASGIGFSRLFEFKVLFMSFHAWLLKQALSLYTVF